MKIVPSDCGWWVAVCILLLLFPLTGSTQPPVVPSGPAPRTSVVTGVQNTPRQEVEEIRRAIVQPRVQVSLAAAAPAIDGVLDDPVWQQASVITDLTQVEPNEGARATESTEVRLLYTADYIYIGLHCRDRNPRQIAATQMDHDAELDSDDSVTLTFDTFGSQRGGYFFGVNPLGSKTEALIEENGELNTDWDAIWEAECRVGADGWVAEIAIPFKSLSFDPKSTTWGFNVERIIRRKQETDRWSGAFKNKKVTELADFGLIQNLAGIHKGLGLDIKPFISVKHQTSKHGSDDGFKFKPGVDIFYSITPSLTASLTINTDFAEVESDDRRVNLTRFPLFFPEKRDFFLQDASLFGFNAYNGPLPFYSRRIGLTEAGEVVDIIAGGKVTGRIGKLDIGLLDVQTDSTEDIGSKNLSVARLSYRVLEESSVGGIFTYGDPRNSGSDYLGGIDFNYRNSHLFGNNVFVAQLWGLETGGGKNGTQTAFGGAVRYPNDPFWAEIYVSRIDRHFDPPLGFVQRQGVYDYGGYFRYRWRPGGYLRYIDVDATPRVYTTLDGEIESAALSMPAVQFTNQRGDSLYVGYIASEENLFEPFEIHPGVVIPTGDYRYSHGFGVLSTTPARPVSAFVSLDSGGFYDGHSDQYGAGVEWRVSPKLQFATKLEYDQIELSAGNFDVLVGSARMNVAFSPRLSWNNLVQYDNVSNTAGFYSRLKWIIRTGSELYLVFKNGVDVSNSHFATLSTEIAMKLVWTWRF